MTNQGVKFYKFSNSTSSAERIASAKATQGAIIYIVDARELWIGGATAAQAQLVIKGANDVTFNNNVLTLTHYDNAGTATTQTLDFSDVASASSTMAVFTALYEKMGLTGASHDTIDYSGTNYLSDLGTTGHPDKNLVNADKALDAAILEATLKDGTTGAVYDTTAQEISQIWIDTVNNNAIADNEALNTSVNKLDKKIAGLADELIRDEQVTQEAFTAVANSVGLEENMSLDLSDASATGVIHDDTDVKTALIHLDNAVSVAGKVDDVKINNTSIVSNKIADIAVEGTYNASTNKIATQSTVSDAINALNVSTDKGAASISGSTITINAVQQENGLIKDGGSTTINLDGTYDASTNKIATKSTVTSAIDAIGGAGLAVDNAGVITATTQSAGDNTTNVATTAFVKNAIDALDGSATIASVANNVVTIKTGVAEADGVISNATGTDIVLEEVAVTGAAADVSIADAGGHTSETTVEGALQEIYTSIESMVGGMRYNGNISSSTATLNSSTNDIRPGDIYLASGDFTIGTSPDEVSIEKGDMIVYKGAKSSSTVTLTPSNCTVIERETDTMVTAGDTLTNDYLVFGNGNKEVSVTSTVDAANYQVSAATLKDAITKANSALQSISKGTDGTYVTTTIGTKTNNDQTVGVAVTQSTVTYTAASDPDPATLTATNGLLNESAITPIKNYVDGKVSTVVSDLDVADYAQATVDTATTTGQTSITIKGIKEADGLIGASASAQDTTIVADGTYNDSTNKLATQSTVTSAINALDANPTSDDAAVANVQVVETNGVITDVVVTNNNAGVSYTPSTASAAPGLTATTATGAVTGADIATIKSYVDDAATLRWEEYE